MDTIKKLVFNGTFKVLNLLLYQVCTSGPFLPRSGLNVVSVIFGLSGKGRVVGRKSGVFHVFTSVLSFH